MNVAAILGRTPDPEPMESALADIARRGMVLVTGALGSIGLAILDVFEEYGVEYVSTDIDEVDVTDARQVRWAMEFFNPATVLHLAGAKHAPDGELDPLEPARVHIDGTANVLRYAPEDCRVVTASTCKACDPETAYGASKLIAERLTLNAGHRVARFHNVVETSGNVFQMWDQAEAGEPVDVADCSRWFVSLAEAVSLVVFAAAEPGPGRFIIDPVRRRQMRDVAREAYPDHPVRGMPRRRGDRRAEPFCAAHEAVAAVTDRVWRITSEHDA